MKTYVFVKLPATSLPSGMVAANTIEQLFEEISMVANPYDVVFKELKTPFAVAAGKTGLISSGDNGFFETKGWRSFKNSKQSVATTIQFQIGTIIIDL